MNLSCSCSAHYQSSLFICSDLWQSIDRLCLWAIYERISSFVPIPHISWITLAFLSFHWSWNMVKTSKMLEWNMKWLVRSHVHFGVSNIREIEHRYFWYYPCLLQMFALFHLLGKISGVKGFRENCGGASGYGFIFRDGEFKGHSNPGFSLSVEKCMLA